MLPKPNDTSVISEPEDGEDRHELREKALGLAVKAGPQGVAIGVLLAIIGRHGITVVSQDIDAAMGLFISTVPPETLTAVSSLLQSVHPPASPGDALHMAQSTRNTLHMPPGTWGRLNDLLNQFRDLPDNKAREMNWRYRAEKKYKTGERLGNAVNRFRKEKGGDGAER